MSAGSEVRKYIEKELLKKNKDDSIGTSLALSRFTGGTSERGFYDVYVTLDTMTRNTIFWMKDEISYNTSLIAATSDMIDGVIRTTAPLTNIIQIKIMDSDYFPRLDTSYLGTVEALDTYAKINLEIDQISTKSFEPYDQKSQFSFSLTPDATYRRYRMTPVAATLDLHKPVTIDKLTLNFTTPMGPLWWTFSDGTVIEDWYTCVLIAPIAAAADTLIRFETQDVDGLPMEHNLTTADIVMFSNFWTEPSPFSDGVEYRVQNASPNNAVGVPNLCQFLLPYTLPVDPGTGATLPYPGSHNAYFWMYVITRQIRIRMRFRCIKNDFTQGLSAITST
jgi:hypothetical protein